MFSEFNDLPVHALAVHGAVVLVPLSALLAVLFAIPRTRNWALWAFPVVTVAATIAVFVSKESGQKLFEVLNPPSDSPVFDAIKDHEEAADRLWVFMLVFTVLALLAFAAVKTGFAEDGAMSAVVSVVVVIGAVVVGYQTYKVGELGSKAVWNPTGDVDYSSVSTLR